MVPTAPQTFLPAPAPLSNTMRRGTPFTYSNTFLSPWQTHSAFSPRKTWLRPTLDWGKHTVRKCMRLTTPRSHMSAWPKSTWASPGGHSRSRKRSREPSRAALRSFTYFWTVV